MLFIVYFGRCCYCCWFGCFALRKLVLLFIILTHSMCALILEIECSDIRLWLGSSLFIFLSSSRPLTTVFPLILFSRVVFSFDCLLLWVWIVLFFLSLSLSFYIFFIRANPRDVQSEAFWRIQHIDQKKSRSLFIRLTQNLGAFAHLQCVRWNFANISRFFHLPCLTLDER